MKYYLENEFDEDHFGIHSQISETLYDIIKDKDLNLSKGSFTLGLFGKWGSGKSLILSQLFNKYIKKNHQIIYIYIDVWKYVDTSLYRSVLFDIEKH